MNAEAIIRILLPLVASMAAKQGDTESGAILQQLQALVGQFDDESRPDPTPEQQEKVGGDAKALYERIKNA